ncbi:MAG: SpoIIE family protein phosphatase [Candidatus Omnitrophica bacterium]|nr:SpoIIE family protein phosphatase [Candidatus Omnitrophota bacterium]
MIKTNSLSYRVFITIFSNILIWFLVIFGFIYFFVSRDTIEDIESLGRRDVKLFANDIDIVLQNVEDTTNIVSDIVQTDMCNETFLLSILKTMVETNENIYGGTISFEPYICIKDQKFFAPYYYKKDGEIKFMRLGIDAYDYFEWDWYKIPKQKEKAIWTVPYFDKGAGDILMTTYSVPFYRVENGKKIFSGVVTADVSLSWLHDLVLSVGYGKTGSAFLVSKKDGLIVAYKDKSIESKKTLFDLEGEVKDKNFSNHIKDMLSGNTGFVPNINPITHEKEWLSYSSLKTADLVVVMLYPEKEVMGPLYKFNIIILLISFLGGAVIIISISVVTRSIIKPLKDLVTTTVEISHGNLDAEVPHGKVSDEIEILAESFENMKISLKEYLLKLKETTTREQRIASELSVAHDIQMSMVPKIFPPFPDDPQFDVYATIQPAKEVGGDFYDFFHIDKDRVCFVIGDVSGKGVPASLFMAVSKTLIKATAVSTDDPSLILDKVNKELVSENERFLFVTVFLGILNMQTGELVFSNAGHDSPFHLSKKGEMKPLESIGGMVLGIDPKKGYDHAKIMLKKGDKIFLFTDGVSEAMNSKNEMFGIPEIEKGLKQMIGFSIREIIDGMHDKIKVFTGDASQYDDITMMCVEYSGVDKI